MVDNRTDDIFIGDLLGCHYGAEYILYMIIGIDDFCEGRRARRVTALKLCKELRLYSFTDYSVKYDDFISRLLT